MIRYVSIILLTALVACSGGRQSVNSEGEQIDSQIEKVKSKVQESPTDFRSHYDLAVLLVEENRLSEALTSLDNALAIESQHLDSRFLKGQVLFELGRTSESYKEFLIVMNADSAATWVEQVGNATGMRYPVKQLTRGNYDNAHPAYAPDGKKIAFQSNRYQNWDLFVYDATTTQTKQLTSSPLHDEAPIYIDAARVLFTRQQSARGTKRDIYVYDATDKKEDSIIVHPADDWYPEPVPGANMLFFVSDREIAGNPRSKIFRYDFADNQIMPFLPRELEFGSPDINSTGTQILFSAKDEQNYALFQGDIDGEKITRLTYLDMDFGAPRFSPDGTRVVFFSNVNDNYDVYELELKSEKITRLTVGPYKDLSPVYSPDGKRIAYYSNQTGFYQLYEVDLANPFSREQLVGQIRTVVAGGDFN